MAEAVDHGGAMGARAASGAGPGRQWWLICVLGVLIMLSSIDKNFVALLAPAIKADLGISDTQMSLVLGLSFGVAYTLVALPAGYFADRIPRRSILIFGVILWCLTTAVCGLANSLLTLVFARALVGLGEGAIVPAAASMIRDGVDPVRRGRAYSVMLMSPLTGSGLSLLVGGGLVAAVAAYGVFHLPGLGDLRPWQMVLIVLGLGGLPLALLVPTTFEPQRTQGAAVGGTLAEAFRHIAGQSGLYVPLILLSVMYGIVASMFGAWFPTLLSRTFGMGPAEIGRTFGLGLLIGAPTGLMIAGALIDRVRRNHPLTGPAIVAIVGAVLVGLTSSVVPLIGETSVLWTVYGLQLLMSGVPGGAAQVILANATPSDRMGKVQGVYMFFTGLAGLALGPTLAAWAGDTFFPGPKSLNHGMSATAAICGVVEVLCAVLVFLHVRRARARTLGTL